MTDLSDLLAECRALDAKATPGPWKDQWSPEDYRAQSDEHWWVEAIGQDDIPVERTDFPHDAAFIARARELLPLLVTECDTLRHENKKLASREALLRDEVALLVERLEAHMALADEIRELCDRTTAEHHPVLFHVVLEGCREKLRALEGEKHD